MDITPTPVTDVKDDPKRPWKAYAATAVTALGSFVAVWVADSDPFTLKEAAQAGLTSIIAAGLTGGVTFGVSNPKVAE